MVEPFLFCTIRFSSLARQNLTAWINYFNSLYNAIRLLLPILYNYSKTWLIFIQEHWGEASS